MSYGPVPDPRRINRTELVRQNMLKAKGVHKDYPPSLIRGHRLSIVEEAEAILANAVEVDLLEEMFKPNRLTDDI